MRSLGPPVAIAVAVLAAVVGVAFLFAPLGTGCSVTASSSVPGAVATPGPEVCRSYSLVEAQPVWPLPLLAVVLWSLAPSATAIGAVRRRSGRGSGTAWLVGGLVAEGTVLISFGAAPLFVPLVLLPQIVATALALASSPGAAARRGREAR